MTTMEWKLLHSDYAGQDCLVVAISPHCSLIRPVGSATQPHLTLPPSATYISPQHQVFHLSLSIHLRKSHHCLSNIFSHTNYRIKRTASMDSPRPSEAETFVDSTMNHPATARLMEEFSIDPNPVKAAASPSTPILFTPAYSRVYNLISAARIGVFVLNVLAVVILMFGGNDVFDSGLLPITLFTSLFGLVTTLLPMIFHLSLKSHHRRKADAFREQPGSTRNAVLVEDPVTGEERWMLEPRKKKKSDDEVMGRVGFSVFDLCCEGLLILSIALSVVYGKNSASTFGWIIADRALMM